MAVTTTEQRAAAQVRRERRPFDGLFQFQPLPHQLRFIKCVLEDAAPWEAWLCAGNRSGKTLAGGYCGATLARYGSDTQRQAVGASTRIEDRATSGWVIGPDFPTLRDTLMPIYFDNGYVSPTQTLPPLIPATEIASWSWDNQVLRLKNGSLIGFKSNEQTTMKFASAGKDWVHFDEEPDQQNYEEVTLRVSGGRHLRLFGTATLLPPEGIVGGISWIYDDIIQPWQARQRVDVAVYGASIYDNPYILPEEVARLEARYPVGSLQRRIRLEGEWLPGMTGVPVYGNFSREVHVRKQPALSPNRPLVWTLDFNVSPFLSLVGQLDRGRFRVLREFCLEPGSIPAMVEAFRAAYPAHAHEVWLYGDASGGARDAQSGKSDWRVVLEHLKTYPSPVKLRVPEANPPVHARINAMNLAMQDETGFSALEIDSACVELTADLERVISDGRGGILKSYSNKDPYSKRTHACLHGDTLIRTPTGERAMRHLRVGDRVSLPTGERTIEALSSWIASETYRVFFDDGTSIQATKDHKFLTEEGMVTTDALGYNMCILTEEHSLCQNAVSLLTVSASTLGLRAAITALVSKLPMATIPCSTCIAISGRKHGDLSPMASISTIGTAIPSITDWTILLASRPHAICQHMASMPSGPALAVQPLCWMPTATKPLAGMPVTQGASGIACMGWRRGQTAPHLQSSASGVSSPALLSFPPGVATTIAPISATPLPAVPLVSMTLTAPAWSVAPYIGATNIGAVKRVVSVVPVGSARVYDMTIEQDHCYLAEGALVSNSDALGYWVVAERPVGAANRPPRSRVQIPRPAYGTQQQPSRSRPTVPRLGRY